MRLLSAVVLFAACASAPAAEPSHFDFHNAMWPNLHHFLYVAARARMQTPDSRRASVAAVATELRELESLPDEQRRAFESALDVYQRSVAKRDILFDRELAAMSDVIAHQESRPSFDAPIDKEVADALRTAAPVYRAVWWPRHEEANRRWLATLQPLLGEHEAALAQRIARDWSARWPATPIRVDVCAYANWAGAYTVEHPPRITFGSFNPQMTGEYALETIFHEPMHLIDSDVPAMLEKAHAPRDLEHSLIFYTAGYEVRRLIPGHVPYAERFGVWDRMPSGMRERVERYWKPYLDGSVSLADAVHNLVQSAAP